MKFVVVADRVVDTLEFTRLYLVTMFDDEIVMIFQSFAKRIEKKMKKKKGKILLMMSGDRYDIPIVRKANREENEDKVSVR